MSRQRRIMSEEADDSGAIRWHDFHNDPNSDVILKAGDGIRLGASRHRLSALSPTLKEMFGQPSSLSIVKTKGESRIDVEEIDLDYEFNVLAAVLSFANNPLQLANKLIIAPLTSRQCRELLDFFRIHECPEQLWDLTLTRWLKYATSCADRVGIAHAIAPCGWAEGLNRVLGTLTSADFAEINASSSTFWAFIEGFPAAEQRQLLRTMLRVNGGMILLPDGLTDISTARQLKLPLLPGRLTDISTAVQPKVSLLPGALTMTSIAKRPKLRNAGIIRSSAVADPSRKRPRT